MEQFFVFQLVKDIHTVAVNWPSFLALLQGGLGASEQLAMIRARFTGQMPFLSLSKQSV